MLPVIFLSLLLLPVLGSAYQIGDSVPLARMGQFHGQRTSWLHQLGRHSPHFGVDTEVVMPIPKPSGFSDDVAYKISFQLGAEKYQTPWLSIIGRQNKEVPIIDVTLRYSSGGDFKGVRAEVKDMPKQYLNEHEDIQRKFLDRNDWPKYVLVRYTWVEKSEIDVAGGLFVLFGSGFILFLVTALHILQSSKEKLARFMQENTASPATLGEIAKAD
ncbi:unnamed protein product [Sphagnum jensenii]|uniref:Uncharacterized protein n=1 Tax=Sphagnum jensenii TaxID=128206 RepID=A0ABP1AFT1_9BRYO